MTPARTATIALGLATVIWGATFPAGKLALDGMAAQVPPSGARWIPIWISAARMLIALPIFVLICPRSIRGLGWREFRDSFAIAFPGALGIALGGWGLQEASVTVTAFLTNLTVVFTPVFGTLFFRERLSRGLIAGATVAFLGVFFLTDPIGGRFGWPEVLVLGSALSFAVQIHFINRFTKNRDAEAMTLGLMIHLAWMYLLPLLIFPAGRALLSLRFFAPLPDGSWLSRWGVLGGVLFLAVFGSVIGIWVFMRWQREIPATRASVIYALEPVFAALLAWGLLQEPMGRGKIAGGILILAGNLVCELWGRTPESAKRGDPVLDIQDEGGG